MRLTAAFSVIALSLTPAAAMAQAPAAATPIIPGGCAPAPAPSAQNTLVLDLSTGGRVLIALRPDVAPKMVERITTLTRQHFYDGLAFHRVIDGFMAQGGDPKGDGTGGSPLPNVAAEFNCLPHVRGAVSAARAEDKNSANSQFFIVFQPKLSLDRKYTIFGRVTDGMQWVDAIERGEPPATPSRIVHAYILADNPPAYRPAPMAAAPIATLPLPTGPAVAAPKLAPKVTPARRRARR